MTDRTDEDNKESSGTSEDIQVPPIPKQTAGVVAGAAIGSVAGPVGAVVGGVVGALAGKAEASGQPGKVDKGGTVDLKSSVKRHPARKSSTKSKKTGVRSRGKSEKRRSKPAQSRRQRIRALRPSRKRPIGRRKKC
jgi:hypothetical protein